MFSIVGLKLLISANLNQFGAGPNRLKSVFEHLEIVISTNLRTQSKRELQHFNINLQQRFQVGLVNYFWHC